ncbi:MAG: hypothetical protein GY810_02810, partial [Aureispira sp.]|nr:hypothetical protein [Aureispira sp.]
MKSYTHFIVLIGLLVLLSNVQTSAQGLTCETSTALCDDITPYPAGTTGASAPAGNNYDCLLSQPDPVFFNITIGQSGTIQFDLQNSAAVDVDFILWGPFTDLLAAEAACGSMGTGGANGNVIDCSYDPQAFETVNIANAQAGEVYIMMVTNYSGSATGIFSTPNTGTGTIVCPCDIEPTFSETPIASNSGVMVDTSGNAAEFRVCPNDTLSFTIAFGADQIVDSLGINANAITIGNAFNASQYNIYGPFYPNAPLFDSMEYIVEIFVTDSDIGLHQFNLSTLNIGPGSACFDTYPITVIVPGIGDIPERDTICSGQDYQVIADVFLPTNGGTSTYSWTQLSGPGATINPNNTVFNPTFTPTGAAAGDSMSFQLEYNYGTCTQLDTIELFFYDIDITMSAAPNPVCAGDPSNLQAILTDTIGTVSTIACDDYSGVLIPHAPVPGIGTLPPFTDLDEGITAALPIGFDFNFYCNTYNQFHIHANGYITFTNYTGTTSWNTQLIPDPTTPNNLIAGAWTDLDLGNIFAFTPGTVDFFTLGTAPNRRLIVNYTDVPTFDYDGFLNTDRVTVQIILYETTNVVEIHATDVRPNASSTLTMGMENANGTLAISPGVNQLNVPLLPNQAIQFSPIVTPGNASINYSWTPSATLNDPTLSNPIANPTAPTTYIVDITNGACTFTDSIFVDITGSLPAPVVTCGTATQTSIQFNWTSLALPAGGFYEYSIDGGATWINAGTNLTATLNSLSPNQTVNILVRGNDNLGTNCSPGAQGSVSCTTLPCALVATLDSIPSVRCFGESNGAVHITVTGGPPTLTYNWSNGGTTEDITGLPIGDYTVTITDGVGCTITSGPHTVSQPTKNAAVAIDSTDDISCIGTADGAIYATTSGGTPNYTYIWSEGTTTEDVSGLPDGSYTVTVTDANGCTTTTSTTISAPTPIVINLNPIDPACNGDATGCIGATVTGGLGNYGYSWSNGSSVDSICGLVAGTYTLTITDTVSTGSGGSGGPVLLYSEDFDAAIQTWAINQSSGSNPSPATNNIWSITDFEGGVAPNTCGIASNGNKTMHVTCQSGAFCSAGGATGAAYNAAVESNYRSESPSFSTVGYTGITVEFDFIGSGDGLLDNASLLYNDGLGGGWQVVPLANTLKSSCCSILGGTVPCTDIFAGQGFWEHRLYALPASCDNNPNLQIAFNWTNNADNIGDDPSFAVDNIVVMSTTSTGGSSTVCTATNSITLNNPPALNITLNSIDSASCNGGTDGAVNITATGGTGTLNYNWTGGQTTQNATGLIAGNYTVTVSDANGCSMTSGPHTVSERSSVIASLDSIDATSCNGGNDGAVNISTTGGVGSLSYIWTGGQTTQDATGLTASSYTVTISDGAGCSTIFGPHVVTEPTAITVTLDSIDATSCNGGNDGAVNITATGGTSTLNYNWTGGQTTQNATGLTASSYTVTVTDANGCSTTSGPHVVNEPTAITVALDSIDAISCNGGNDGAVNITTTGGTGTLNYNWTGGQTTQNATGLTASSYIVTVTDANGCSTTSGPHVVNEPTVITVALDSIDATSCNGGNDGAVNITATGGTGTLNYNWTGGQTTQN